MKKMKYILTTIALMTLSLNLPGESEKINYNTHYAYPFSMGIQYLTLGTIGKSSLSDFTISEVSGDIRIPFRNAPTLQPMLRLGMTSYIFDGDMDEFHQDWTHQHYFAAAGLGYINRISGEFELGVDLVGGVSQSYYTELSENGLDEDLGQLEAMGRVTGRLALNPSYNVSISVSPALNYSRALGIMDDYDGFTFGVGFSAAYRFGKDPDRTQNAIKAIRFEDISVPPLFSAMQSYYVKNPAGTLNISNKEKAPLEDLSVSFLQPGFMDSPSPVAQNLNLEGGGNLEIPLYITFNNEVFSTQGVTPLTGEVITTYTIKGREVEQRQSVSYDLYDRNALTWDDDRKAAAFITPQDSALRNYASHIRQIHKEEVNPYLNGSLQYAMQVFNALGELGLMYQVDPGSPFTQAQEDALLVDSISLPRETLIRKTGDCDDLTVLFCTLLESVGIETALVTVPGHIYCAFNTGVPSGDYAMINPDRSMSLAMDGELWVPVEITLIGLKKFSDAWRIGISEFSKWEAQPEVRGVYRTGESQSLYRSIVLRETDLGLQYGDSEEIQSAFRDDLSWLNNTILQSFQQEAYSKGSLGSWNALAVAASKIGAYDIAEKAIKEMIRMRPDNARAQLNLGSLYYTQEKYGAALTQFKKIEKSQGDKLRDNSRLSLYLNISKAGHALGEHEEAEVYYQKAYELKPDAAVEFAFLGTGSDKVRAAEAGSDLIEFFE